MPFWSNNKRAPRTQSYTYLITLNHPWQAAPSQRSKEQKGKNSRESNRRCAACPLSKSNSFCSLPREHAAAQKHTRARYLSCCFKQHKIKLARRVERANVQPRKKNKSLQNVPARTPSGGRWKWVAEAPPSDETRKTNTYIYTLHERATTLRDKRLKRCFRRRFMFMASFSHPFVLFLL